MKWKEPVRLSLMTPLRADASNQVLEHIAEALALGGADYAADTRSRP